MQVSDALPIILVIYLRPPKAHIECDYASQPTARPWLLARPSQRSEGPYVVTSLHADRHDEYVTVRNLHSILYAGIMNSARSQLW